MTREHGQQPEHQECSSCASLVARLEALLGQRQALIAALEALAPEDQEERERLEQAVARLTPEHQHLLQRLLALLPLGEEPTA